jgi:Tfp pilus assembly protein PilN
MLVKLLHNRHTRNIFKETNLKKSVLLGLYFIDCALYVFLVILLQEKFMHSNTSKLFLSIKQTSLSKQFARYGLIKSHSKWTDAAYCCHLMGSIEMVKEKEKKT